MNNEENDIERQELAQRVGKNGDRILMEYFDDILKSNETNRYILECLIDKIWIYHDKSVKFELKPEISRLI